MRWWRRRAIAGAVLLAAGSLAGCPPAKPPPLATMPAAVDPGTAPILPGEPTAGGIYVPPASYTPLTGEARKRAMLDRGAILLATKARPDLTTQPSTQAASQPATQPATSPATSPAAPTEAAAPKEAAAPRVAAEPPPLAVKYYLQGREKFLDGANSQAMDYLDKALALDPNAFTVLRLMGRVCFASSQLARGSLYLQRAYAIDPGDVEVNYLLGRYWLERKENGRAVSHLLQADDSPERAISSAQTPLVQFYLARAMEAAGYHKAAAEEFERFLETISLPVAGYRYDRELNYLIEESWAVHLSAADNDVLVGDYAAALPHYEFAADHEPKNAFIASRLVNAQVHAGKPDEARRRALELVRQGPGTDGSIQLLAWAYRATGRGDELIADLRRGTQSGSVDDPSATLTLAAAQDYLGRKDQAFATMRDYLQAHPTQLDVLVRLLKRIDSAESFREAVAATAEVLSKAPQQREEILKIFMPVAELPAAQLAGHEIAGAAAMPPYEAYLYGVVYRAQDDLKGAESCFQEAAKLRQFFPAREALVSVLIAQEKFREASKLIEEAIAGDEGGAKAYELLLQSEAAQERLANALKIALDARRKFPDNTDLRLELATIYRLRGQDDEADRELHALIDASPKLETAYQRLINSLLARARSGVQDPGAAQKYQIEATALLSRLLREVPGSVYGRVTTAILNARDGLEQSEATLRRLLPEHPDDPDVLIPLAQIRDAMGEPEQAVATLQAALKNHPTPELTQALAALYRDQEKPADALALTARMMKENPASDGYVVVDAGELLAQKRQADAIAVLAAALPKFPRSESLAVALARLQSDTDEPAAAVATMQAFINRNGATAQRLYLLSHFQEKAGQMAENESTLRRILTLMPDHTGANNDLGYFWADAGKNLDLAEPMIKKALENQPNNSAFLDSLGWVYYKQGRFAQAEPLFEKAISQPDGMEPEVLGHLGDTLFRLGRVDDARRRWTEARGLLMDVGGPLSRDEKRVRAYLDAVLDPHRHPPPVSPLGKGIEGQSAGPAQAPGAAAH